MAETHQGDGLLRDVSAQRIQVQQSNSYFSYFPLYLLQKVLEKIRTPILNFNLYFHLIKIISKLREETITWDVNYSSAFILTAEKTSVEGQEELLVFDKEDLINGIGGALGLFLGWSILYLGITPIFVDM